MLRALGLVLAIVVVGVVGLVASDVTGRWEGAVDTPDGPFHLAFEFAVDGPALTGTVESVMGTSPLVNGKVASEDTITFDVEFEGSTITHQGKLAGDEITITAQGPWGESVYTVTRVAAK